MAQFNKINSLKIGNHVWHFTSPQIIEWESDENSVTMRAVLRVQHEEHLTLRATDAEDSAPSQAESNAETLSTSDGGAVPTRRS